eukprot:403331421
MGTGTFRTLAGAKNLYNHPSLYQQMNPHKQNLSKSQQSMRSMSSSFSAKKSNKHSHCKESHLPLNQEERQTFKHYEPSVKSFSSNIITEKNLFQEVDCLIIKAKSLMTQQQYRKAKDLLEHAVNYEGVRHADVFYLVGEANLKLGNLVLAEQYLLKALSFEFHSPFTYSSLAHVYKLQNQLQKACALYKRALEQIQTPDIAFELAQILQKQGYLTESLVYYTKAIDLVEGYDPSGRNQDINSGAIGLTREIGGEKIAEYYMNRSQVYEALGLIELSRKDMYRIKEYDSQFMDRQYQKSLQLEENGNLMMESFKIRQFLQKMQQV